MGYVYATTEQKQKLEQLTKAVTDAKAAVDRRKLAKSETEKFVSVLRGMKMSEAVSNLAPVPWPDNELITAFSKKYPYYFNKGTLITQKLIVTFAADRDSAPEFFTSTTAVNPFGGAMFLGAFNQVMTTLQENADSIYKAAKEELDIYSKFLDKQDKDRDAAISTAGISNAVKKINDEIERITGDPVKIVLYAGAVILAVVLIYYTIKFTVKKI